MVYMFIGRWQPGVLQEGPWHWLNSCLLALAMWATHVRTAGRGRELGMPCGQGGIGSTETGNGTGQGLGPGKETARTNLPCPIPVTDIPADHYRSIKPAGNALGNLVPLGNEAKTARKFCSFPSSLDTLIQLLHKTSIKNLMRVHVPIWLLAAMSPSLL